MTIICLLAFTGLGLTIYHQKEIIHDQDATIARLKGMDPDDPFSWTD